MKTQYTSDWTAAAPRVGGRYLFREAAVDEPRRDTPAATLFELVVITIDGVGYARINPPRHYEYWYHGEAVYRRCDLYVGEWLFLGRVEGVE